jgi:2-oxoglutarate dehydrogenase E1 component
LVLFYGCNKHLSIGQFSRKYVTLQRKNLARNYTMSATDFTYITQAHPSFIEGLYNQYLSNPNEVDAEFKKFFEGFDYAVGKNGAPAASTNGQAGTHSLPVTADNLSKEFAVYQLIQAYRKKGHLVAKTNPIRERKDRRANLDIKYFGLTEADLSQTFGAAKFLGLENVSLQNIINHLQKCYTTSIGVEYGAINSQNRIEWLAHEFETKIHEPINVEKKKRILSKLNEAVIFESFLHKKYIGQKRFSLEGGETTIAALDAIINTGGAHGVKEIVIGMAHRGRLNVLANTMGKTYEQIFSEFEGKSIPDQTMGSGDVKYHLGFSSEVTTTDGNKVYLKLTPNPSHLEAVNPVVAGYARSKADVIYESNFDEVLPILIHGDASVAGQGIVYEVLQMSDLKGYYTGGTIHFVINNQIGFTTDWDEARSSDYCTSIASLVAAPVFHVNGDDPEAVVKCVEIATRYRQEFNSDVFIDMVCYRKHGHNEGDDPKYTQPLLYNLIEKHKNPRELYSEQLIAQGSLDADIANEMEKSFWATLQERLDEVKQKPLPYNYQQPELWWKEMRRSQASDFDKSPDTAVSEEIFRSVFNAIMEWPADFKPLKKVEKLLQEKIKLIQEEQKLDWATAELMAYGTLIAQGYDVRMSGQDVKRGTFSHRHAVLRNEETNDSYNRLSRIPNASGKFRIYNSLLSEYAVLGFEYGYSLANPRSLVLWEAQFGDFCNGAQTIIDQFIASAESKWQKMSGLVMLLPHGYEGQGPEHSSARLERFLQMCAGENMVITNITSAANFFHALRRQMIWQFRKPLINFSPKAHLRLPGTFSHVNEFLQGGFKEVIDDMSVNANEVRKVILCSGKIYFDLLERQQKAEKKDTAVVRLEQMYPLPAAQLQNLQQKYANAFWLWVQEEPLNMGAATFIQIHAKFLNIGVVSRQPSASTATGYAKVHAQEQGEILDTVFSI